MTTESEPMNILNELHSEISKLPILFRERVCEECNYSTPTFYRKIKGHNRWSENKPIQVLSNAEKEKICEIAEEVTTRLVALIGEVKESN